MTKRMATYERETNETKTTVTLDLDGCGTASVNTGIGFLDHLLNALVRHARFDATIRCEGDLEIDDHHTAEDTAIAVGRALDRALGPRTGIQRFGSAYAPLDEALSRAVVDISGRGFAEINLDLRRDSIGGLAGENVSHVLASLATAAGITAHVDVLRGRNDHHRGESAFKALALALREAVRVSGFDDVPSTKGIIDTGDGS